MIKNKILYLFIYKILKNVHKKSLRSAVMKYIVIIKINLGLI